MVEDLKQAGEAKLDRLIQGMIGVRPAFSTVVIEGRQIPQLGIMVTGDTVSLCVDNRFSIDVPRGYAHQVAWLVANALAVGAGYACLSSENKNMPFAPQVVHLGAMPQ